MTTMEVSLDMDRNICRNIGHYYFEKNSGGTIKEQVLATRKEIESLHIVGVHYDGSNIIITVGRPGLLIGYRGKNIRELEAKLRKEYTFNILQIVEDTVICNINTFEYILDEE